MTKSIFLILLLFFPINVLIAQLVDSSYTKELEMEIDGLIIDDTTTKLGKDFYDIFYTNWVAPPNTNNFSVTISEKPLPRLGTQISISINDNQMFQSFLQPRYDIIETTAFQAIAMSQEFLINYEAIQKQLQGEDLKGSGIF